MIQLLNIVIKIWRTNSNKTVPSVFISSLSQTELLHYGDDGQSQKFRRLFCIVSKADLHLRLHRNAVAGII